jgi:photosystem II stability/assembly factor-like uncharacterized protein
MLRRLGVLTHIRAAAWLVASVSLIAIGLRPASGVAQETELDSQFLESFTWRSIGPANMSGRITDIEGIPGTATFYVAAATAGIWKTTNNGTTFRPLFTEERVAAMGDLAIAPSNPEIVWAGTGEEDSRNSISPGGGVYKSTDGGLTWELMGLEDTHAIGRILVHPTNADLVYVAALGHIWGANEERGLYRTRDGGESWERIHYISEKAGFVDLVMHPNDPNTLFASSWERVRGPWFLNSGGPGSALWKSTDGGDTWSEVVGAGFPATSKGRIGLAIARSNPDVMYALVEAEEPECPEEPEAEDSDTAACPDLHGSGLYRSEDGGRTWSWMNGENTRPFYYSQVRVDPSNPDHVVWSSTPVRFSKDGGKTVGQTTIGIHVDHHALWWDPENPDHYIVGNDGGIGITWDKGGNYDFPNALALGQFYAVSYNMDFPYRVCGGLQDNGTWCGPSRRRQGDIDNHMWATVSGGDGFYAPQDPEDSDLMYAESQGGRMSRINTATGARRSLERPSWSEKIKPLRDELVLLEDDAGDSPSTEQQRRMDELKARITADSAAYSLRYNWSTPMVLSPHDRDVLYVGASRVLKSTDRGDGLTPISPDLTYADTEKISVSTQTTGGITRDATGAETHATITTLAESYMRAGWLYVGTDDGRVWMTRDDGASWTELTGRFDGVPEGTWVSRVEPSHHDASTFYVSFDGHRADDFRPHLYVTTDGGETFRSISTGLPTGKPDYIHVVREDPHNPDLLFVGTDVGVYMSLNRGVSWQRFMNGLPTVPVHDLKIHPRERELIAGTHGRSVWIVDIAPLEQMAGSGLGEDLVLFEPKPALQYGEPPIGGESTGHRTFAGQGVRYGAEIAYWIPGEVSTALMREAREARQAAADAERPLAGSGGAGQGRPGTPQAQFAILDSGGDTVQVLTGAMASGLRKVYWDFRPRVEPEPKSPSELRDSVDNAKLMREVADSLIADGEDEALVNQAVEEMSSGGAAFRRRFGGGGGTPQRGFRERPGETYPRPRAEAREAEGREAQGGAAAPGAPARAGAPAQSEVRAMQRTIRGAMRDRGAGFGGFGGFGGAQEIADPGTYTVVMTIGNETRSVPLTVIRAPGYSPDP